MKRFDLSIREFGFMAGTRAALGVGIGLLAAGNLSRRNRRRVGATLLTFGALTTIPILYVLFGRGRWGAERRAAA